MKPETKKIVTALGLISFTVVMLGIEFWKCVPLDYEVD